MQQRSYGVCSTSHGSYSFDWSTYDMGIRQNAPVYGALIFGTRSAITVGILRARLEPDTRLYSHGHAWWSSPFTAFAGLVAGRLAVDLLAVLASAALGYAVGYKCKTALDWKRRLWLLWLSPPGWFAGIASADAIGAAAAVTFWRKDNRYLLVVAACHLEAALVLGLVHVLRRFGSRRDGLVALVGGAAAVIGQWHLQTRYFLPGAAIVAAGGKLRNEPARDRVVVVNPT